MNDISLKEYISKIIELKSESTDRALILYQKEMERRLEALNELRGDVVKDRSQYYRLDNFTTFKKEYDSWRENVNASITEIRTRNITWTAALGIAFIIIEIVLRIWVK